MDPAKGGVMLGQQLGTFSKSKTDLTIWEQGLSIRDTTQAFEGPYGQIDGIHFQETRAKVNGVPVVTRFDFRVRTPGGDFSIVTRNKAEGSVLGQVVRLAEPALIQRALNQIRAGQVIDCGDVRVSPTHFAVKKGSKWIQIPLEQLAGFVLRDGWLLVDRDPQRPRILAELQVGKVANTAALLAVLTALRPDADLTVPANLERVKSRASKAPWGPSTAATRWAGTPTKRARFFLIAALPALALLYVLVTLPVAISHYSKHKDLAQVYTRVTQPLAARAASVTGGDKTLAAACAGKLEAGGADSVIAYLGPLPPSLADAFNRYDRDAPRDRVLASNARGYLLARDAALKMWDRPSFFQSWSLIIGEVPTDWGSNVMSQSRIPDLRGVRYVVLAQLRSLDRDPKRGKYDSPPIKGASFAAEVLDISAANTSVCKGTIRYRNAEGRGARNYGGPTPVQRAVLQPVCAAGGKLLCDELTPDA